MQFIRLIKFAVLLLGLTTSVFPQDPTNSSVSATNIDYTIQEFNKSGSFTINVGMNQNKSGKMSGYIRLTDENGNVLQELTPEILAEQLEALDKLESKLADNPNIIPEIKATKTDNNPLMASMRTSLKEMKETLENEAKMRILIEKLNNASKMTGAGLPWSKTLSTIRSQSATVDGCLDCN